MHTTHDGSDDEFEVRMDNRRQLSGSRRADVAESLQTSAVSATELHFRQLADMSEQACQAGNRTVCQTPAVMRQAAYERRQSDVLHHDPVVELDIAKECWQTAMPAEHVSGYIQQLGSEPFHVVFYCQQQVQLYVDSCKAGNATLHVDATGCVVRNIRGQKRALYYCVVLGDCSIPVFDAVTTRHTSEWLQSLLMMFNASVRRVNHGRLVTPRFVVTDFSFALITACLGAFNGGMQLDRYLRLTYQLMQKTGTGGDADSVTVLCVCAAHMLKMLSMRLRRKESRKEVRKLTLTYFGSLQRTTTLTAAGDIYRHICVVLTSRLETRQVSDARLHLTAAVSGVTACHHAPYQ